MYSNVLLVNVVNVQKSAGCLTDIVFELAHLWVQANTHASLAYSVPGLAKTDISNYTYALIYM